MPWNGDSRGHVSTILNNSSRIGSARYNKSVSWGKEDAAGIRKPSHLIGGRDAYSDDYEDSPTFGGYSAMGM
ncbi:MAG: hypothetical protein ACYTE0_12690 [Planctomycetota bacterium]